MLAEDESRPGGHAAGRTAGLFQRQQGGPASALRAPGGRPLVRAALQRADHLQAAHPPRAPVLQEPAGRDEEVHPAVQRYERRPQCPYATPAPF